MSASRSFSIPATPTNPASSRATTSKPAMPGLPKLGVTASFSLPKVELGKNGSRALRLVEKRALSGPRGVEFVTSATALAGAIFVAGPAFGGLAGFEHPEARIAAPRSANAARHALSERRLKNGKRVRGIASGSVG